MKRFSKLKSGDSFWSERDKLLKIPKVDRFNAVIIHSEEKSRIGGLMFFWETAQVTV